MTHTFRTGRRRFWLQALESRIAPVADFQITSLTANNAAAVQHDAVTGDDFGGIAVSGSQAFVTGATATGRFALSNLGGGTNTGFRYDAITSDLKTQKVYTLATQVIPGLIVPLSASGGMVTHLIEIDGATGNLLTANTIPLSMNLSIGFGTGIFAGYERIVIHTQPGGVYEISLPSGQVTILNGLLSTPPYRSSNNGFGWYWGTAEHFGGQDYLDYVQDMQVFNRQRVSDGAVTTLAVFSNLADMASFTASPGNGRWYFHLEGPSQFTPGAGPQDEFVGFADATYQIGGLVVTNTNNSGTGSLRDIVAQANANPGPDIVNFQPGLTGTINLSSPITFTQPVEIAGPGSGVITVSGTGSNSLFQDGSPGGALLTVHGLTLSNTSGLNVAYPLSINGEAVLSAGAGDVTFTSSLTVSGSLTLTDGNGVELGPTTTLNTGTVVAPSGLLVGAGDVLTGNGTASAGPVTIQAGGKIAPLGVIRTGNLVVQNSGTIQVGLYGPGFNDWLLVIGTVALNPGNVLSAALSYVPDTADTFLVIANNQSDAITGTLAGVRNRSGLAIGGTLFQVRHDGGDGNDLELWANDSPVLDTAAATSFPIILEDLPPAQNSGLGVDALVGTDGLYTDGDGVFRSGIAVTGLAGANGTWQYSRNAGATWTAFPAVAVTSAVLLEADGAGQNRVRFLPAANFFGTETLSFKGWDTTDGRADGTTGVNVSVGGGNAPFSAQTESAVVQVLAVNDAPLAGADSYTLAEDTTLPGNPGVLANDTDVDGPFPLTTTLVDGPAHGSITLNADGTFTYNPAADYNGPDAFTYRVADANGLFDVGTVSLTITPVNDNPNANSDTATATEDGGLVSIDVLANDTAAPDSGETLTVVESTAAVHGSVTIAADGKSVLYAPSANYTGPDTFSYSISDGNGGTASAVVNVTIVSVNDPPDAAGDVATVIEDAGPQTIDVLANDLTAPDAGETLTVGSVSQGAHGTVTIAADGLSVQYTPNPDYAGPDAFFYTIADGNGGSDVAAVSVTVTNDAADRLEVVTSPGSVTFTENGGPVAVDPGVRVGAALEGILTSATVRFTSGYVKGKDKLVFAPAGGIKATFSATTGTLTLSGAASPAGYQAALRSVTYINSSPAPVDGPRILAFQVKDTAGTGDPATRLLRVVGVNSKPTLALPGLPLTYKNRGRPLAVAGTLLIKDIDNTRLQSARVAVSGGFAVNQDSLSVIVKPGITANYEAATGVMTLTGNGTIATYMAVLRTLKFTTTVGAPAGARTLSITVNDGLLDSDPVTRTVNVQ
jgi:Big-like domain-containing protein